MASHKKSVPNFDEPRTLFPLNPQEREKLLNDPHYQRIVRIQKSMLAKYGVMEDSWSLIREDRDNR